MRNQHRDELHGDCAHLPQPSAFALARQRVSFSALKLRA